MTKTPERLMLDCVNQMLSQTSPQGAVDVLLPYLSRIMDCHVAMILTPSTAGVTIKHAEPKDLEGNVWPNFISDAKRLSNLHEESSNIPNVLEDQHSAIIAPILIDDGPPAYLVCTDPKPDTFTDDHLCWLADYAAYARHALIQFKILSTSTFMTGMIRGSSSSFAVADATKSGFPLVYVNKAFEKLTGYKANEVIGENCRFLSAETPTSATRTALRETVNAFGQGTYLLKNKRKDGSLFWNQLSIHPVFDTHGKPQNLVATQIDVTDQIAAKTELDQISKRLSEAIESTEEAFIVLDHNGGVAFMNGKFEEFFGVRGATGSSFVTLWCQHMIKAGVEKTTAQRKAKDYLEILLTRKRSYEEVLIDGRKVLINERPTSDGGAVIVVTDITRLKTTERRLEQRVAAIDTAQDGIAIATPDHRITYINPSLVSLWQHEIGDDVLGRQWPSQYDLTLDRNIQRKIQRSLTIQGVWSGQLTPKSNPDATHEVSISSIPDTGIVLIVRDISDRIALEQERARLQDQLAQSQRQEAIGQLAAGIAHDFNNLLSAITGSANLISTDDKVSEATRTHADRITSAGYRAARIVNKLIDLGSNEETRIWSDLRNPLREAADLILSSLAPTTTLTTDIGVQLDRAFCNQTDILQIVLNLMINAQDALNGNNGEISLTLASPTQLPDQSELQLGKIDPTRSYACITVADTGEGIDADGIATIFKPYFTTKGAEGTGLGLAVVSSIVAANDAGLRVFSVKGVGTRFEIYWPIGETDEAFPNLQLDTTHISLKGELILVVDDDVPVAQVLSAILEHYGAEVAICETPELALETVTEDPEDWSCLITDYDMPGMNGGQLIQEIGKVAPILPKILVTALARRLNDPKVNKKTVDAVLAKPVAPEILIQAVRKAIDNRGTR